MNDSFIIKQALLKWLESYKSIIDMIKIPVDGVNYEVVDLIKEIENQSEIGLKFCMNVTSTVMHTFTQVD